MDPITIGAGITAAGGLLSQLFGLQAQREMAKKKAEQDAIQQGFGAQMQGAKALSEGQMSAYQNLLGGLRSAIIGG